MDNQHQTQGIEVLPPSFTMRVGNRRLTLSWRPRKPVPGLLAGLLRRAWQAMFGTSLRITVAAAAVCAAWNAPALAAAPPGNALPAGWNVAAGSATFAQNGNTLTINQSTNKAIVNFNSFSIGANAVVDISQPSAAAAFLARVTGSDPSLIYGMLKSNGSVALINQNGILVGPTGVVDVARFIASTLNISDSDFLAGRLNFTNGGNAGNVENQGAIKSATGGSVYLIGVNVDNSGIISSANGEILLAAGQTVQLLDTATPGVSVNVTGTAGKVTNIGTISAEAGRIGIAAGLISNSGNINASSVVSEGGRIFLRASQNLTTSATSKIAADGAKGGSVVLYSDGAAYIDGDVSAQGAPGKGGYVETSGKQTLDVVKVPTVGSGGEWYIDPYDLEVIAGDSNNVSGSNAISSSGASSKIKASTIVGLLDAGTDVTLTTGSGGADAGNITVSADIAKIGAVNSNLTLNAYNNISINANITSSGSALNLSLNSDYQGDSGSAHDATLTNANISLNGGILNVTNGNTSANSNNGGLNIGSNSRVLITGGSAQLNAGAVTVGNTGSLVITGGNTTIDSFTNNGNSSVSGGNITVAYSLTNNNLLNLSGSGSVDIGGREGTITNANTGTLNIDATSLTFARANSLTNDGTFNLKGGSLKFSSGHIAGLVNIASGATLNLDYLSIGSATFTGTGNMVWTGNVSLDSTLTLAAGGPSLTMDGGNNTQFVLASTDIQAPATLNTNGAVTARGDVSLDPGVTWNNGGTLNVVTGNGEANRLTVGGDGFLNNLGGATINMSGPTGIVATSGSFVNNANATLNLGTCSTLSVGSFTNNGTMNLAANSTINSGEFSFVNNGTITGSGKFTAGQGFTNNGVVAPGGAGTVGTLRIEGTYNQSSQGELKIDVAGDYSYDRLEVTAKSYLGGTLRTNLLGGYVPTLGTTFQVITGSSFAADGFFRTVTGSIVGSGDNRQMLKARYDAVEVPLQLEMKGSENVHFVGNADHTQWDSNTNWSTNALPTEIDHVYLDNGLTVVHANGTDLVDKLSVTSGSGLSVSGGQLDVNTLDSAGTITIGSGTLALSGAARIRSLVMDSGTVTGTAGSVLNVTDNFSQGEGIIQSSGDVSLSQASGDLVVGNISARNLVLESQAQAIRQQGPGLHVTKQLIASSATGTTLDNTANRIAAFAANNRGTGDIVLVNHLERADASVVTLNGITNSGGNISVNNTGGLATAALGSNADFLGNLPTESGTPNTAASQLATLGVTSSGIVKSSTGTVSLITHSPLTIGSGGVNAAGNIVLTAGNTGSNTDNLIVNGLVTSAGGNITLFAGNNLSVNANISTSPPGQAIFSVANGVISYSPGVSITDVNGTKIPVAVAVNTLIAPVVAPSINQIVTSTLNPQVVNVNTVPPVFASGNAPVATPVSTQTIGGTSGNFGGEDDKTPVKNKPLPVCT
ncbi:S-layer family protein [Herbaspirillum sp. RV1423]|uniref:beta strand repeat-containing protein n=1 Tax=Herbaspirillum sp. RV1423 TaxID=1443993 RepID=UPI0004B75BAD|nr:filamentous hemagglutinin N-terminal domain-containing protein [Herbaspirillum sp. RV1423]